MFAIAFPALHSKVKTSEASGGAILTGGVAVFGAINQDARGRNFAFTLQKSAHKYILELQKGVCFTGSTPEMYGTGRTQ